MKALFKFLWVALVILGLLGLLVGAVTPGLVLIGIGMFGIATAAYGR